MSDFEECGRASGIAGSGTPCRSVAEWFVCGGCFVACGTH